MTRENGVSSEDIASLLGRGIRFALNTKKDAQKINASAFHENRVENVIALSPGKEINLPVILPVLAEC